MANFLFYKYHFEYTGEKGLFTTADGEKVSNESLNVSLAEDLMNKKSLNLYAIKTDKKGVESPELYANNIQKWDSGVAFMQVRNNKCKRFIPIDKIEAQEIGHYPISIVIVDTRPDSMAILVLQKKAAFPNADYVANFIVEYFSRELGLSELVLCNT